MPRQRILSMVGVLLTLVGSPCLADYVAEVTADSPTSWWRFEDASSSSGQPAADSAGMFAGTYTGDVQLLTGIAGQSARFDGHLDYVAVGPMGALPEEGSIELWMRAEAVQNYRNVLTTGPLGGMASGNNAIRFEEHATGVFYLAIGDDSGGLPDLAMGMTANLAANKWYHVVVTWDTDLGLLNGYLDGERVIADEANTFWPAELSDVKIGIGYTLTGERSWLGRADEVAIYDYQLSPGRILAHHDAATLPFIDGFESGDTSEWSRTVQ